MPQDLNGVPPGAELWRVGKTVYVVYTVPGSEPPVPMGWRLETSEDLEALVGPDQEPRIDRTFTSKAEAAKAGLLDFGTRAELAQFNKDPLETFEEDYEEQAVALPMLRDPEVYATFAAALYEGREPTPEELSQTDWWQSRTEGEREWVTLAMQDPRTAAQMRKDRHLTVRQMLSERGLTGVPYSVEAHIAREWTEGRWTDTKVAQQIDLLANPSLAGSLDQALARKIESTAMPESATSRDAKINVANGLREAGMHDPPQAVIDVIADKFMSGAWSQTEVNQQIARLADPWAPGEIDPEVRAAMTGVTRRGPSRDAEFLQGPDEQLRERIRQIFVNRQVPIGTEQESEEQRLDRILAEVRGGRSLDNVRDSVDRLASDTPGGTPGGLDVTRRQEDRVEALVNQWLGPHYAEQFTDRQISEWAGQLRNNPDAEQQLVETLKAKRLAAFPGWENENLTYEDIAPLARGQYQSVWGQVPDETDPLFLDLLNMRDATEISKRLRREGMQRGVSKVADDFQRGLLAAGGGQVRESAI